MRPTVVLTEMGRTAWSSEKLRVMEAAIPMRRLAEPADRLHRLQELLVVGRELQDRLLAPARDLVAREHEAREEPADDRGAARADWAGSAGPFW